MNSRILPALQALSDEAYRQPEVSTTHHWRFRLPPGLYRDACEAIADGVPVWINRRPGEVPESRVSGEGKGHAVRYTFRGILLVQDGTVPVDRVVLDMGLAGMLEYAP